MTIEDETAIANIIVWSKTFARFRPVILGARYVAVSGEVQQESGVIHVVARARRPHPLLARLTEDAPPIEALARADAVGARARRVCRSPAPAGAATRRGIAAPDAIRACRPDLLASDLDVPARGSAHAPSRRGGSKVTRR